VNLALDLRDQSRGGQGESDVPGSVVLVGDLNVGDLKLLDALLCDNSDKPESRLSPVLKSAPSLVKLVFLSLNAEAGEKISPNLCLFAPSPPPSDPESSILKGFLLLTCWLPKFGKVLFPTEEAEPALPLDRVFFSLKLCLGLVQTESGSVSPMVITKLISCRSESSKY